MDSDLSVATDSWEFERTWLLVLNVLIYGKEDRH